MTSIEAFSQTLANTLGPSSWITDEEQLTPWVQDQRGLFQGRCLGMALPKTVEDVAKVISFCREAGVAITPQGGNTGLVGGSVPLDHGREIILSTRRLNALRDMSPENFSLTAEAGCSLSEVQEAAAAQDRLFPLSYASEGTATLGGAVSSNSGGVQVLRYGNCRDLVLGLEAVLPNGEIWHGLRGLRKDNRGYDLKQLLIGAEGTLGIVTAATVKLFSRPRALATAFVALPNQAIAMALLAKLRNDSGDLVTAFEFMDRFCLELVTRHIPNCRDPFTEPHACYALIQLSSGLLSEDDPQSNLIDLMEYFLGQALEEGWVCDALIAQNDSQSKAFWRLRESLPEAQTQEGGSIKHDISVPLPQMATFIDQASIRVKEIVPGCRPAPFGHVGDGNIHFNITQPLGMDKQAFLDHWEEVAQAVHTIAEALGGSMSAEHGIGRLKREALAAQMPAPEMTLMRGVKQLFDPENLMNPGKVV